MTRSDLPRETGDTGFLNAEDFVQQLIGRSRLERDDDTAHGTFGLRDVQTGARIRVPMEELNHYSLHQSSDRLAQLYKLA